MLSKPKNDLRRMREEYAAREDRLQDSDKYSATNPAYQFLMHQREIQIQRLMEAAGWVDLADSQVLEIGCGRGEVLETFQRFGVPASHLFGIDLLHERVKQAGFSVPDSCLVKADAQSLPFTSHTFDVLLQFTAFSSVLDSQVKQNMASEMLRVLKDDGVIIWYDFWWNPLNRQTNGIRPSEIKHLFPQCDTQTRKITLAPPIVRILIPKLPRVARWLEGLIILNSHYLALIRKKA